MTIVYQDGVIGGPYTYGMHFAGGEITVQAVNFAQSYDVTGSPADVYVTSGALWARFINNYHETRSGAAYSFGCSSRFDRKEQSEIDHLRGVG